MASLSGTFGIIGAIVNQIKLDILDLVRYVSLPAKGHRNSNHFIVVPCKLFIH